MAKSVRLRQQATRRWREDGCVTCVLVSDRAHHGLGFYKYFTAFLVHHSRFLFFCCQVALMASTRPLPSGFRPICRDPTTLLKAWCASRHASLSQTTRIVALLDKKYLFSIPRPPRTTRRAGCPHWKWGRFLFRRHIQHILFWQERRPEGSADGFSDDLNWLIRVVLFPDPAEVAPRDGEHARGGPSACPPADRDAITSFCPSHTSTASLCGSTCSTARTASTTGGTDEHEPRHGSGSSRPWRYLTEDVNEQSSMFVDPTRGMVELS